MNSVSPRNVNGKGNDGDDAERFPLVVIHNQPEAQSIVAAQETEETTNVAVNITANNVANNAGSRPETRTMANNVRVIKQTSGDSIYSSHEEVPLVLVHKSRSVDTSDDKKSVCESENGRTPKAGNTPKTPKHILKTPKFLKSPKISRGPSSKSVSVSVPAEFKQKVSQGKQMKQLHFWSRNNPVSEKGDIIDTINKQTEWENETLKFGQTIQTTSNSMLFYMITFVCVFINMVSVLIYFAGRDFCGKCIIDDNNALMYWFHSSMINFIIGLLFRLEIFVKMLYVLAGRINFGNTRGHRLKLKLLCHRVIINIGACHVGFMICATVKFTIATLAFIYNNSKKLNKFVTRINDDGNYISSVSVQCGLLLLVLLLLFVVILFAQSKLRHKYHNCFEFTHRYLVYFILLILWAYMIIEFIYINDEKIKDTNISLLVLLIVLSLMSIIPWLSLRKVNVQFNLVNKFVMQIEFDPSIGYSDYGEFARISLTAFPKGEWHAFAPTLNNPAKGNHSLLISKAGDWTSNLFKLKEKNECPKFIYTRVFRNYGFMYFVQTYKNVLFVATGAGIAPVLPYYYLHGSDKMTKSKNYKLEKFSTLWLAPNPETNFKGICDKLTTFSNTNIIYDTKKHDRPDMKKYIETLVSMSDCDAVFCVSNPKVTNIVLNIGNKKGIATYGAIWDS